jgi:hypothetical protein
MPLSQQVETVYVLYKEQEIVSQGGFQVSTSQGTFVSPMAGDRELKFDHSYLDTTCKISVKIEFAGIAEHVFNLDIPINRTKLKWKFYKFGTDYELCYRSMFESENY